MTKKTILGVTLCFVLFLNGFGLMGAIPTQERAALIALYNSTNGGNWYRNTWKTPPLAGDGFSLPGTEGNWTGIKVLGDHVTEISLWCNRLIGTIPVELGNLSYLETLRLENSIDYIEESWNHLSGPIPAALGNLTKLKYLTLNFNRLSGSIPAQLGNLTALRECDLSSNQLSGTLPWQLGNLVNLEKFWVAGNELSGTIPAQMGNLVNLQSLILHNNQLSGAIPSTLVNLTKINLLSITYNCLTATGAPLIAWLNSHNPAWNTHQDQCGTPEIALNRTALYFGENHSGIGHAGQIVQISNTGRGTLKWSATCDNTWFRVIPTSGTGDYPLLVKVFAHGLEKGRYSGTITVSDPDATNSPKTITVTMEVYENNETVMPFGQLDTPLEGATLYGSIPVTGWALDNMGVRGVQIFNGDTFLGDAAIIEGARPDLELAYPTYPSNYKAGWGYMLLTHMLPNGGNGTYTLIAKATDYEGNEVVLGSRTITIDNAHAIKPFGAIDTPAQGGMVWGKEFVNFGWALTPQPNAIPLSGSTIDVVIDGVIKGHPVYNNFRADIATLFPGYANSNGAVGYYYIDATQLKNGLHTIAWNVTDNAGNTDGIGSRYFTIDSTQNRSGSAALSHTDSAAEADSSDPDLNLEPMAALYAETGDPLQIQELERLELHVYDEKIINTASHFQNPVEDNSVARHVKGYLLVGDQLRELPIGSTLDQARGIFYWQPGPGFVGPYYFVFTGRDENGQYATRNILVNIEPKY